jgi:hypothetical protein
MKDLFSFVKECEAATPGNTMGMGNPTADDGDGKGSEPLTAKAKKEHPHRKHKKKKAGEEE